MIPPSRARLLPVFALGVALSGCTESEPPRAANACIPDAAGAAWTLDVATAAGPYAVGTHEETFVDSTRGTPAHGTYAGDTMRTLLTSIWYPAAANGVDAQIATGGPFPIVMYSHGFSSMRAENSGLAMHLASHGYVVIATTFPVSNINAPGGPSGIDIAEQPHDVSFVLDQALGLAATPGSVLEGGLDDTRVAAAGLSMGGLTTLLVTYHAQLRDPRIDLAIAMAPLAGILTQSFYETTEAPLMVLFGDTDAILGYDPNATRIRDRAHAPLDLITLSHGTHTGFITLSTLFEDTYDNVDTVGCEGFGIVGGTAPATVDFVALLGGAAMGIETSPTWDFCPANLGIGMKPTRQLLLENAAVRSQLDSYFSADATTRGRACHFVEQVLPRETDLDLFRR